MTNMLNLMNLSASSSFSSNKSFSSASSSSIKDSNNLQQQQQQQQQDQKKRVVVILKNENNKKFKDINSKCPNNPIYRHSMSFPSCSSYQSSQSTLEDQSLNIVLTDDQLSDKSTSPPGFKTSQPNLLESNQQVKSLGVVKNLRKKFLTDSDTNRSPNITYNTVNRGRSRSELISNFQLKKCRSVILDVSPAIEKKNSLANSKLDEKNVSTSNIALWKKARSNNFLSEHCDLDSSKIFSDTTSTAKTEDKLFSKRYGSKERINEFSMFENVNIKEKINKFSSSLEPTNLSLSKQKAINLRQHPMKYGGSCNNLLSSFSPNQSTDTHNKSSNSQHSTVDSTGDTKNSITSDSDVSNDDSCSDDMSSTSLSENNLPVQPQSKNNIHVTNIQIENSRPLIPPKYRTELNLEQQNPILNTNSNKGTTLNKLDGDIKSKPALANTTTTTRANPSLTINVNNSQYKRFGYESVDSKNLMSNLQPQFNPLKFEEDYKKIKDAFDDLKKDNELIENLLTDMRSKVKETTVSFVDNFLAQNFYDLSNGMEAASVIANQIATSTHCLRDSTNSMKNTGSGESNRDSEVVGLEVMKLLQPVKENNFVNSKLIEFESKNLKNGDGQYQSVTKSPFKNKFRQLMPNETNNIQQLLIRHKF